MKPREWQRDVYSALLPRLIVVFALLSNGIWAQDAVGTSTPPVITADAKSSTSPPVDQMSTSPECGGYGGGSIALAVILTLVVLLCLQFGAYLVWRQYAKKMEGQHLVLLSDPEKGESAFAFDNPGFKEGPSIIQPCPDKESNNKQLKWPRWNALNTITLGQPVKVKAMDDTYQTHPQLNVVPLRSHDFTGLGFNICGNMRDGIFVKDVLHRGPASESGRIFTGDRIESIKISFRHMVFEDALTILSYASPYEVELSVEPRTNKKDGPGAVAVNQLLQSSPLTGNNASGSQTTSRTLSHPFFKSHSITDIYKIAKTSNRRSGDPLNESSENKTPNSLERRSKFSPVIPHVSEHEKSENAKNSFLEHNCVRTNDAFTEIRLDEPDTPSRASPNHRLETSTTSSSPSSSSTNVKAVLAKGIKNLKDKIHHSLHSDDRDTSNSAQSTLEKKTRQKRSSPNNVEKSDDGFQTLELVVPDRKESQKKAYLFEELIVQDPAPDVSDSEDPVAAKRNKRKAPKFPPSNLNDDEDDDVQMIMMMRRMESGENRRGGRKFSDSNDSMKSEDSTTSGGKHSGTTIELNSSHITVHQAPPDSESRKASSLGDLSRFENTTNGVIVLERAVSLDLADGSGNCVGGGSAQSSKKRKAPMPPQEDCLTPYKEARLESAGSGGTLKKSSVWGNLEDVIQNDCDSDADLGISGCSTPEKSEDIVTSTPFKFSSSTILSKNENGISEFQVNSSSDWDKSEFITALNGGVDGDDTPPELPSSPMPPMSSFITEIQVVTAPKRRHGDNGAVNEVIHLDSTEKFLDHVASSGMMMMNNSSAISPTLSFEELETSLTLSLKNDPDHENEEKVVETTSLKKEAVNNIHSTVSEQVAPKPPPRSDRESSVSKIESKSDESNDTTSATPTSPLLPSALNKSPNSRPPSSASNGSGKLSGGNVSVTSIKGQSRIPVRASGARSPGSTLSPSSDKRNSKVSRNGHSSP